jgi:hypothetical protein
MLPGVAGWIDEPRTFSLQKHLCKVPFYLFNMALDEQVIGPGLGRGNGHLQNEICPVICPVVARCKMKMVAALISICAFRYMHRLAQSRNPAGSGEVRSS